MHKLLSRNPAKRPLSSRNSEIQQTLTNFVNWSLTWTANPKLKSKSTVPEGSAFFSEYNTLSVVFINSSTRRSRSQSYGKNMVRLRLRHILSSGKIEGGTGANVQIEDKNLQMLINSPSDVEKAFGENGEEILAEKLQIIEEEDGISREDFEATAEALETNEKLISSEIEGSNGTSQEEEDNLPEETSVYERNAVTFFAGYIASKSFLRSKCEACRESMMKTPMEESQDNEYYIRLREYKNLDEDAPEVEKLTRSTNQFTKNVHHQLKSFEDSWEKYWVSDNMLQRLFKEAEKETEKHFPEWFKVEGACYDEHRLNALKLMLRVKIYAKTRVRNGERQPQKSRMKNKGRKIN